MRLGVIQGEVVLRCPRRYALELQFDRVCFLRRNYEVGIISVFWDKVACSDGFQIRGVNVKVCRCCDTALDKAGINFCKFGDQAREFGAMPPMGQKVQQPIIDAVWEWEYGKLGG